MPELLDIYDKNGNRTGFLVERGKPLNEGEYVLGAHVWIINSKDEFLLTKRSKVKGGKWHGVGGMAAAGDDGFTTALREADEEIGIVLNTDSGQLFKRHIYPSGAMIDVWIFRQDVDISKVVLQEEEASDAILATREHIQQMIEDDIFIDIARWYPYLEELLEFVFRCRGDRPRSPAD